MVPPIPTEPMKQERQKGYLVKYSYDSDFVNCMLKLEDQYPEEVFSIQGIASKSLDVVEFSRNFFKKSADQSVAEHSVDGNANVNDKSIHTYVCETPKAIWKLNSLFLLWKWVHRLYGKDSADKCLEKVITGELFVNDMTGFHMPYCFAFDLRKLTTEGMSFFNGNFPIKAPKRSDSFNDLVNQATAYISNQIMGAASYPNYFPILDWYYRREFGQEYMAQIRAGTIDKRDLKTIRNQFQNLIYSLNFPFRGSQSAFTNLSVLDKGFCTNLFSDHVFVDPDNGDIDMAADHFDSIIELSKLFFEYYTEINGKEGMFTFPVMTIAISLDDNGEYIDPDFAHWAAKYNCEKALANIFQDRPTSFSSCCRLRNDFEKMGEAGFQNSFGVGGLSIGSHRVAGINMPRLAILEKKNPKVLDEALDCVHKILTAHRALLNDLISRRVMPLYSTGWIHLNKQYSTIGIIGCYEYLANKGVSVLTDKGQKEMLEILAKIEEKGNLWPKEDKGAFDIDSIYNIEQIPGESMAVRLADLDRVLGFNDKWTLYSNQYIPLIEKASIFDRFKIQGVFDQKTSGGAILHLNIDDEKPISEELYYKLIDTARKQGCKYFAVNYAYCECKNPKCRTLHVGKTEKCSKCGGTSFDVYTRVVGFITNVGSWNGVRKKWEFPKREFYNLEEVKE